VAICLELGTIDLNMAQLVPLTPYHLLFNDHSSLKSIQVFLTFLVLAYSGCREKQAIKWVSIYLSVYYILFVSLFLCTVTDFSAAEKGRGMKFCMRVGLLSRQVFSTFGEVWLAVSHGGGITFWDVRDH